MMVKVGARHGGKKSTISSVEAGTHPPLKLENDVPQPGQMGAGHISGVLEMLEDMHNL